MIVHPTVVAAIVGFFSAIITSIFAAAIGYQKLKAQINGRYKLDLIKKQIHSVEKLWMTLEPASMYEGNNCIIIKKNDKYYVQINETKKMIDKLIKVFFSDKSGLYFSQHLRSTLFDIIEYMRDIFMIETNENETEISNNVYKNFRHKFHRLINAMRAEIGVENLKIGKTEPI
ncbi:MAG TPA: hypothetical protein PLP19_10400 [bacterium]|nr:hypothetical protein [bacterium]HPN43889.1 hypothetical protein [bacterium]